MVVISLQLFKKNKMNKIELYQKTYFKLNLILGIIWLFSGLTMFFIDSEKVYFYHYISLILGLLYIFLFFYEKLPFFVIENNLITKVKFPKRQFNLNNMHRINRNESGYKLISKTQEDYKITTSILKEEDSNKLKLILEEYETKITTQ